MNRSSPRDNGSTVAPVILAASSNQLIVSGQNALNLFPSVHFTGSVLQRAERMGRANTHPSSNSRYQSLSLSAGLFMSPRTALGSSEISSLTIVSRQHENDGLSPSHEHGTTIEITKSHREQQYLVPTGSVILLCLPFIVSPKCHETQFKRPSRGLNHCM